MIRYYLFTKCHDISRGFVGHMESYRLVSKIAMKLFMDSAIIVELCRTRQSPRHAQAPVKWKPYVYIYIYIYIYVYNSYVYVKTVTRSFDVLFDVGLNNRRNKQWSCRWFETPLRSYDVIPILSYFFFRFSVVLVKDMSLGKYSETCQ